ncbi:MAG: GTPase domain-containing protein [Pirellulales bacterium]|nr:GTPase domain-containing protein [Pirellulales bacterium]
MKPLELLAEVDSLVERLEGWAAKAPAWEPARTCRAIVGRLATRAQSLRVRLQAPLVVATLGGTGTGKSALVNALVGAEVVRPGRERPTTLRPTLVCRPDVLPELLGIDPASVELVQRDLPALSNLVLVDCPDPDTTEEPDALGTNLSQLRRLLPHCDVLLVTTTQQKYRSARVADELAAAAGGARLIFVQTHADQDDDVRDDWRRVLGEQYTTGRIFLVDSLGALEDARQEIEPRGEMAALVDLLTRQLAGLAPARIRRANFLDLADESLEACQRRVELGMPAVGRLEEAIAQQRTRLAARFIGQMRTELTANRRQWESRLLGKVVARWGFSPWSLVLRIYQGLGGLLAGTLLWRARTPAQMALWGTLEGARAWRRRRKDRWAQGGAARAVAAGWDETELRAAVLVLEGYAREAQLPDDEDSAEAVVAEAIEAGTSFARTVEVELDSLLGRLAARHAGWFTRWRYEILFGGMAGVLLYRLGKNFFWDSWWAEPPVPVFGLDFYVSASFWLVLWCVLLLWSFSTRLRRGLRRQIGTLADAWSGPEPARPLFRQLESQCRDARRFAQDLGSLRQQVAALRRQIALADEPLGHRRVECFAGKDA